jgi:dTDP-4-amino-4,6-dideoxygalactose transaminase
VLDDREVEAARRVVLSGWVSQGPEVAAFEREFAARVGASHACAVSNCTTALHLALLAVGVSPGDEVITVSHSFVATANTIRYCGAEPVFVDIEADGFNIDVDLVEAAITPRTRAIVCVHQLGMPCDVRRIVAIAAIARRRGLAVVEDAACAIASEIFVDGRWEKVGRPHGDIACFSFHPRKVITTGEGGMLTTANPDYDRRFRLWRQHSMSVSDTARHGSPDVIFEEYPEVGYNYRMTDLQAAIGREQLMRLPAILETRRRIAARYTALLSGIPGLVTPKEPEWAKSNWQSYCVRLPESCDQRETMQALLDRGFSTRRGVMNAHLEAPYRERRASARVGLPHSEAAQARSIILPLFPQMTDDDVAAVAGAVAEVLAAVAA